MKKKLKIEQLKLKSFVTSTLETDPSTIRGGKEYEVTKRVINDGCWASEAGGPYPPLRPPKLNTDPIPCGRDHAWN